MIYTSNKCKRVLGSCTLNNGPLLVRSTNHWVARISVQGKGEASSISHVLFFFPPHSDFEDDGEEEEDKDSDSEDVKEEVGTLALASNDLYIHNSTKENVPFYVQLSPG